MFLESTMKRIIPLIGPSLFDHSHREKVKQFRVRWFCSHLTQIIWRRNQSTAKQIQPRCDSQSTRDVSGLSDRNRSLANSSRPLCPVLIGGRVDRFEKPAEVPDPTACDGYRAPRVAGHTSQPPPRRELEMGAGLPVRLFGTAGRVPRKLGSVLDRVRQKRHREPERRENSALLVGEFFVPPRLDRVGRRNRKTLSQFRDRGGLVGRRGLKKPASEIQAETLPADQVWFLRITTSRTPNHDRSELRVCSGASFAVAISRWNVVALPNSRGRIAANASCDS